MPARKIDFYLNASNGLRALSGSARRLTELQRVLEGTAPKQLTQACCVKQLRAGNLVLLAGNAAVAAKLRQLAARLLATYKKLGTEVTSIRIEVQVSELPRKTHVKSRSLSAESVANICALTAKLDDTPLRAALNKLATRHSGEIDGSSDDSDD